MTDLHTSLNSMSLDSNNKNDDPYETPQYKLFLKQCQAHSYFQRANKKKEKKEERKKEKKKKKKKQSKGKTKLKENKNDIKITSDGDEDRKTISNNSIYNIKYNIPDYQKEFQVRNDIDFLLSTNIPFSVKAHLAKYLHASMSVIEEFVKERFDGENFNTVLINKLKILGKRFRNFHMDYRDRLSRNFLITLFWIRCKLDFLLEDIIASLPGPGEPKYKKMMRALHSQELISSRGFDVVKLDMRNLWRLLMILVSNFNNLVYSENLDIYVQSLYICCCSYATLSLPSRLANFPPFIQKKYRTQENTIVVIINENYLQQMEYIFYNLFKRIQHYKVLVSNTYISLDEWTYRLNDNIKKEAAAEAAGFTPKREPPISEVIPKLSKQMLSISDCMNFYAWMRKFTQSAFHDIINDKYKRLVYDNHLLVTEKDRYIYEYKYNIPTSYNIIARYRPNYIDKLVDSMGDIPVQESIDKREHLLNLNKFEKQRASKKGSSSFITSNDISNDDDNSMDCNGLLGHDADFYTACFVILFYYFEVEYSGSVSFFDFLITANSFKVERIDGRILESSKQFPYIVQGFNLFGILYNENFQQLPNIEYCIMYWVMIACEDPKIKGVFPNSPENQREVNNLLKLYNSIFPNNTVIYERTMKELSGKKYDAPDVILPDYYQCEEASTAVKKKTTSTTTTKKSKVVVF